MSMAAQCATALKVIQHLAQAADELLQKPKGAADKTGLLSSDPARFLQQRFEAAFSDKRAAPYGATIELRVSFSRRPLLILRRCVWGFKAFEDHLTNSTLLNWLWSQLDTALVLERKDGTLRRKNLRHPSLPSQTLGCVWRDRRCET